MQIFITTFSALFPLYAILFCGFLLRKTRVIKPDHLPDLNRLVFKFFMPFSLFHSIYEGDLNELSDVRPIIFALAALAILFLILHAIIPRIIKSSATASTIIHALYRSNFLVLGLAYSEMLYGREHIGPTSVLIATVVPFLNVLSILTYELLRGEKCRPIAVMKNTIKNPQLIATALAIFLRLLHITLPNILYDAIDKIAGVASPLALTIVGAAFTLQGMKAAKISVIWVSFGRLVLIPCIFVPISIALGFRNVTLIALLVIFGGPVAITNTAMAYELGGDGELSGQLALSTTQFSLLTMFLAITLLRTLGFC